MPAIYCSIGSKQISSTIINDGNAADEQCDVSADSAGRRRRRRRRVGTRWLAPSQTLSIRDLDVVRQSLGEANQRRFPLDGSSPWQPRPETRTHHRKKKKRHNIERWAQSLQAIDTHTIPFAKKTKEDRLPIRCRFDQIAKSVDVKLGKTRYKPIRVGGIKIDWSICRPKTR